MFLAYIFPISERSAVNLYGKNNTTNITHFDTKEDFYEGAGDYLNKHNENKEDGGGYGELGEEYMDLEAAALDEDSDGEDGPKETDLYTEYKNFWSLQNLFSVDLKTIKPADMRKSMNKVLTTLECHHHAHYDATSKTRRCVGGYEVC